jgi:peptide/nickel transport system substrate-binding protein
MIKQKLISLAFMCVFLLSACAGGKPAATILRVGWASEPDTMNPLTTYSSEAVEIIQLVYDKLLGYDLNLKPQPELAKDYAYSTDGLTLTFNLRNNAKWQDGQSVTADDVVYTYNLIKDNELGSYAQWLTHMTSIEAVNSTTVKLIFDLPQAFNPGLIIPILPKHIWSGKTVDEIQQFANETPIGSGPYRFVEWKNGSSLTLERNPDFWGTAPKPEKITFVLYSNEDVMAQALKSGEVDILTEVPPTIWDGLKSAPNVKLASMPSYSFHHIGFNVSEDANSKGNPLLRDRVIRQALNYAVDRNQLVQIALAGHGRIGDSIIPIGITDWYTPIPASEQMNANPEKAKQILDAAGYMDRNNDGIRESDQAAPLEFRLIAIQSTSVDVRAAQLFRDAAMNVGIKLDLQTLDENTLGNTVYNTEGPDWDIFVWGWDSSVPDPDYMLGVPLCSQIGGNNDVFYCNSEYDALYDQQASTIDASRRKTIVDTMQKMYYDDAAYIVMWYQDKLQAYNSSSWQGWKEIPGGIIYNLTRENYMQVSPAR